MSDKISVDLGQSLATLLSDIEIPREYEQVENNRFGQSSVLSYTEYVRGVQVETGKRFNLNKLGSFFNVCSEFGDYFNEPDAENDRLPGNELKIEWLLEVRSKADNAAKTYTFRQNVPIVIK